MAYVFRTKDKDGKYHDCWRFQYTDWTGKRRTATGYTSKTETEKLAASKQREQDEIRRGYREPPQTSHRHKTKPVAEIVAKYLEWGRREGGRGGRPWSRKHGQNRERHLAFWQERLGLETLQDLDGILSGVQETLSDLRTGEEARSGKTLMGYAESLKGFCKWCIGKKYLAQDPMEGFQGFDTTPTMRRRALTAAEIKRLLDACAPHRRLLYEVAFCSGLRANELRSLRVEDLDTERGGLALDGEWTKNRKPGFQPLPAGLVERLQRFIESREALRMYRRAYRTGGGDPANIPTNPLLYVGHNPGRDMRADLGRADIPEQAFGGKVDFHACRTAYVTFVLEAGAQVKEAQELARHSTPHLTMNVYGRAREERLAALTEAVGDAILFRESTISTQRKAAGAESYCQGTGYVDRVVGSSPTAATTHTKTGRGQQASSAGLSVSQVGQQQDDRTGGNVTEGTGPALDGTGAALAGNTKSAVQNHGARTICEPWLVPGTICRRQSRPASSRW